jgi:hypothetical protein
VVFFVLSPKSKTTERSGALQLKCGLFKSRSIKEMLYGEESKRVPTVGRDEHSQAERASETKSWSCKDCKGIKANTSRYCDESAYAGYLLSMRG